jgi:hypothetical protein
MVNRSASCLDTEEIDDFVLSLETLPAFSKTTQQQIA